MVIFNVSHLNVIRHYMYICIIIIKFRFCADLLHDDCVMWNLRHSLRYLVPKWRMTIHYL